MEILVWIILLSLFTFSLFVFHHWLELFHYASTYSRDELMDIPSILREKMHSIAGLPLFGAGFLTGAVFSWLLVLFGGLVSPDITGAPGYGENTPANYFFQSLLFPVLLSFLLPSLKDLLPSGTGNTAGMMNGLLIGCALSLGALNLSIWGVHHNTRFLFMFLNCILLFIFALYKFDKHIHGSEEHEQENTLFEDSQEDSSDFTPSDEDLDI